MAKIPNALKKPRVTKCKQFLDSELSKLKIQFPFLTIKQMRKKAKDAWTNINRKNQKQRLTKTVTSNSSSGSEKSGDIGFPDLFKPLDISIKRKINVTKKVSFNDSVSIKPPTLTSSQSDTLNNSSEHSSKPSSYSCMNKTSGYKSKMTEKDKIRRSIIHFTPEEDPKNSSESCRSYPSIVNKSCSWSYKTLSRNSEPSAPNYEYIGSDVDSDVEIQDLSQKNISPIKNNRKRKCYKSLPGLKEKKIKRTSNLQCEKLVENTETKKSPRNAKSNIIKDQNKPEVCLIQIKDNFNQVAKTIHIGISKPVISDASLSTSGCKDLVVKENPSYLDNISDKILTFENKTYSTESIKKSSRLSRKKVKPTQKIDNLASIANEKTEIETGSDNVFKQLIPKEIISLKVKEVRQNETDQILTFEDKTYSTGSIRKSSRLSRKKVKPPQKIDNLASIANEKTEIETGSDNVFKQAKQLFPKERISLKVKEVQQNETDPVSEEVAGKKTPCDAFESLTFFNDSYSGVNMKKTWVRVKTPSIFDELRNRTRNISPIFPNEEDSACPLVAEKFIFQENSIQTTPNGDDKSSTYSAMSEISLNKKDMISKKSCGEFTKNSSLKLYNSKYSSLVEKVDFFPIVHLKRIKLTPNDRETTSISGIGELVSSAEIEASNPSDTSCSKFYSLESEQDLDIEKCHMKNLKYSKKAHSFSQDNEIETDNQITDAMGRINSWIKDIDPQSLYFSLNDINSEKSIGHNCDLIIYESTQTKKLPSPVYDKNIVLPNSEEDCVNLQEEQDGVLKKCKESFNHEGEMIADYCKNSSDKDFQLQDENQMENISLTEKESDSFPMNPETEPLTNSITDSIEEKESFNHKEEIIFSSDKVFQLQDENQMENIILTESESEVSFPTNPETEPLVNSINDSVDETESAYSDNILKKDKGIPHDFSIKNLPPMNDDFSAQLSNIIAKYNPTSPKILYHSPPPSYKRHNSYSQSNKTPINITNLTEKIPLEKEFNLEVNLAQQTKVVSEYLKKIFFKPIKFAEISEENEFEPAEFIVEDLQSTSSSLTSTPWISKVNFKKSPEINMAKETNPIRIYNSPDYLSSSFEGSPDTPMNTENINAKSVSFINNFSITFNSVNKIKNDSKYGTKSSELKANASLPSSSSIKENLEQTLIQSCTPYRKRAQEFGDEKKKIPLQVSMLKEINVNVSKPSPKRILNLGKHKEFSKPQIESISKEIQVSKQVSSQKSCLAENQGNYRKVISNTTRKNAQAASDIASSFSEFCQKLQPSHFIQNIQSVVPKTAQNGLHEESKVMEFSLNMEQKDVLCNSPDSSDFGSCFSCANEDW